MTRAPLAALLVAATACAHAALWGERDAAEAPPAAPAAAPAPSPTPAPAPPATPPRDERIAALRLDVDRYLSAQAEALWQAWTTGAAPDLERSAAAHQHLFTPETLALVRGARDGAAGDERRALSLLHAFLVGEHLAREAQAQHAAAAAVSWDGGSVPGWRVPALLAAEDAPARRAALERAWAAAERRRANEVEARWTVMRGAAQRLGYPSLLALAAELRGEPIESLARLAERVLDETAEPFRALLGALARVEMGRPVEDLRGRDLPRLFRSGDDARAFPAARAAEAAGGVLPAVGIDVASRPGVVVDDGARPGKDPRALAVPVRVPESVRLSYTPAGGASALRGLLHELGAAAFYAHAETPVLEFRRLGNVTAEVWAELLEDLASDPLWLADRAALDGHHLATLLRAAAVRRLHRARTLAARVLVEVARTSDAAATRARARTLLERALLHPVEAEELDLFLAERDPLLEAADTLRAMLLGAQARVFLDARSPPAWWRSRESGAFLTAAFAEGSRLPPAELARALGSDAVSAAALVQLARARGTATGLRLPEPTAQAR